MYRNKGADEKQFANYKSVLGKDAPKNLTDFQQIKYNNATEFKLMKGYVTAVSRKDISALVSLSFYRETAQ